MDSKPVFVIATAKTCLWCHTFRQNWEEIRQAIENTGIVRIVDIEVNSINELPSSDKYPRDLSRWVRWYPTFLLFKGRLWDHAMPGPNKDVSTAVLEGSIFNGYITRSKAEFIRGPAPTKETLLEWIRKEVASFGDVSGSTGILSMLTAGSTRVSDTHQSSGLRDMDTTRTPLNVHEHPIGTTETRPTINLTSSSHPVSGEPYYIPTSGSNICKMKLRPKNP